MLWSISLNGSNVFELAGLTDKISMGIPYWKLSNLLGENRIQENRTSVVNSILIVDQFFILTDTNYLQFSFPSSFWLIKIQKSARKILSCHVSAVTLFVDDPFVLDFVCVSKQISSSFRIISTLFSRVVTVSFFSRIFFVPSRII